MLFSLWNHILNEEFISEKKKKKKKNKDKKQMNKDKIKNKNKLKKIIKRYIWSRNCSW